MTALAAEDLERARRQIKRRVAAVLIHAMAETDIGFDVMALRLGQSEETVRRWLYGLVETTAEELNELSDIALAMGCELTLSAKRLPPVVKLDSEIADTQEGA